MRPLQRTDKKIMGLYAALRATLYQYDLPLITSSLRPDASMAIKIMPHNEPIKRPAANSNIVLPSFLKNNR
jgi:hypothetical protein